jgi:hypothetical protein
MLGLMRLSALILLALAALAGCGSSSTEKQSAQTVVATTPEGTTTLATTVQEPSEKPDDFMKRVIDYDLKGQFGRAWDVLHPGQQTFVSREKFQDCQSADFTGDFELTSAKTMEIYDDRINVLGVPQRTSKAVTLKISGKSGETSASFTRTLHAVLVSGRWAWVLPNADARAYKAGACPS